ncbi:MULTISPECIES: ABC transporter permease [unclassified Agarivorans]|uniref:ABC transporter permease n=1 Tax=unclassified Agarivorans TaxID=2636026 RepID=UPI0026E1C7AD|nr:MULTISPECIES: ABC transporter permease [unclassified Agarivorans]MDO6687513.1 ABC transporter permease [Agarivorans sp. 3_MG-2023]MDO6717154.1 ABC transporter permease [Agarivorans sp. 2_MG-2023]
MTIDISWSALGLFCLVLLIPVFINWRFNLALGKDIGISLMRMLLQLALLGVYLQFLFELNSLWVNLLWLTVMLLVGASAIIGKAKLPRKALFFPVLSGLILGLSPLLVILLLALLKPAPAYSAQYLIPLAGMLLGNSLSGNIVALQRLFSALNEKTSEYQGYLALGASRQQATQGFLQSAMQQAFAPVLASMSTVGLVTLPGMMTGQILAGSDPMVAVKYQLVILIAIFVMLSISIATTLSLSIRVAIGQTGLVKFGINKTNASTT